jgi:hypothetical protein
MTFMLSFGGNYLGEGVLKIYWMEAPIDGFMKTASSAAIISRAVRCSSRIASHGGSQSTAPFWREWIGGSPLIRMAAVVNQAMEGKAKANANAIALVFFNASAVGNPHQISTITPYHGQVMIPSMGGIACF